MASDCMPGRSATIFKSAEFDDQQQALIDKGKRADLITNALLGVAGAFAITAAVLYFVEAPEEASVLLSPGSKDAPVGAQLSILF